MSYFKTEKEKSLQEYVQTHLIRFLKLSLHDKTILTREHANNSTDLELVFQLLSLRKTLDICKREQQMETCTQYSLIIDYHNTRVNHINELINLIEDEILNRTKEDKSN